MIWKSILLPIILILLVVDMLSLQLINKIFKQFGGLIYVFVLIAIFEIYCYQVVRTAFQQQWIIIAYTVLNVLVYGTFLYFAFNMFGGSGARPINRIKVMMIILTLFVLPKLFLIIPLVLEDFFRIGQYITNKIGAKEATIHFPSRRRFLSLFALGFASIPFFGVLHGITVGRYKFRVIRKKIFFEDLPEEFDGFTITHISDIHSGSFEDREKVMKGVQMVQEQGSDIIAFTGDMVNNESNEMEPWVDVFKTLSAPVGMFSVFGNHDYAYYGDLSKEQMEQSKSRLKEIQKEIGFQCLDNQKVTIERNGKKLNIVGVENWGASRHFPKSGDLKKATEGIEDGEFNVLLSHDPSHFDFKEMEIHDRHKKNPKYNQNEKPVVDFEKKIHLTLSGHTHGMQFGIEIPGLLKWSPVKYRYPKWAGLYQEKGKYLYVNRGFGFIAFPGRVGIWPEITVLELKRKRD